MTRRRFMGVTGKSIAALVLLGVSEPVKEAFWGVSEAKAHPNDYYPSNRVAASLTNDLFAAQGFELLRSGDCTILDGVGTLQKKPDGRLWVPSAAVNINFALQWWTAVEVVLQFNKADDPQPQNTVDFINILQPDGQGTGSVENRAAVIHFSTHQKWLRFEQFDSSSGAGISFGPYTVPDFKAGDTLRLVAGFNPLSGMDFYAKFSCSDTVLSRSLLTFNAKQSRLLNSDPGIYVGDSGAWHSYGSYQPDSHLRYFVVRQEALTSSTASKYLANPASFMVASN